MSKLKITTQEQKVLKLFRECDQVDFYKFNEKNPMDFPRILAEPELKGYDSTIWAKSEENKIQAIAFKKDDLR